MGNEYILGKQGKGLEDNFSFENLPTRKELINDLSTVHLDGSLIDDLRILWDLIRGNYAPDTPEKISEFSSKMYEFIRAYPYAKALDLYKQKCRESDICIVEDGVIKQPSLLENLEARVHCLETKFNSDGSERTAEERAAPFLFYLDSRSGIAYPKSAKTGKNDEFMYIPDSLELVNFPDDFNQRFMPVEYNALDGIRLKKSNAKYNERLLRSIVPKHDFWLTVADGNDKFLVNYIKAFDEARRLTGRKLPDKIMGVYIRKLDSISQDQLRALCVSDLDFGSSASGDWILDSNGARFALVSQNQPRKSEGLRV